MKLLVLIYLAQQLETVQIMNFTDYRAILNIANDTFLNLVNIDWGLNLPRTIS